MDLLAEDRRLVSHGILLDLPLILSIQSSIETDNTAFQSAATFRKPLLTRCNTSTDTRCGSGLCPRAQCRS